MLGGHRQPGPRRARLPARASARSSRRSRSRWCCCGCSARRRAGRQHRRAHRAREPLRRPARHVVVSAGYGAGSERRRQPRRARPDPHGLPRRRWGRCAQSPATSAGSSPSSAGATVRRPRPPSRRTSHRDRLLRRPRRRPRRERRRRSRRRTAGWPVSCTRTSTPAPRPRSASRRSRGLRGAVRPDKKQVVRPRRRPVRGRRGGFGSGFGFTDIMDAFFGAGAAPAAARARAPAPRPGRPRSASTSTSAEAAFGGQQGAAGRHRGGLPDLHAAAACQPGTSPRDVRRLPRPRRGAAGAAVASSARS